MLKSTILLLMLPLSMSAGSLQERVTAAVSDALQEGVKSNQLAISVMHLGGETAHYRGDAPIYPASVVKLFYLVAAHQWMEDGKIQDADELRRAMRDMIVQSYNEATHYVLDQITHTTSGPELSGEDMKAWADKRNVVNRWFASRGYRNLNVNQKPWCEGPYGRERVFVGKNFDNRNALTTEATATLLAKIVRGEIVSKRRCDQMMELLRREPFKKGDDQATEYTGKVLPPGSKLWSKAGWTSTARHDAAYVELPQGEKFVLVIFTTGHSRDKELIATLARRILKL